MSKVNDIFSKLMGKGIKVEDDSINQLEEIPDGKEDEFVKWLLENNIDYVEDVDILKFKNISAFPSEDMFEYINYDDEIYIEGEPIDWVKYFNSRFEKMKNLFDKNVIKDTVKLEKVPEDEYDVKVYGTIMNKWESQNGHYMVDIDDDTGKIRGVILEEKTDLIEKAKDILLDTPIVLEGGTSDDGSAIFVNEIYTPQIKENEKTNWDNNNQNGKIIFASDFHIGSEECAYKEINKFINYVNDNSEDILSVFHLGDLIDNTSIYPDHHKEVKIKTIKKQYDKAANILSKLKVPIVFTPGNHDLGGGANKIPRPSLLENEVTQNLHNLENVRILSNPSEVIIDNKFRILLHHGEAVQGLLNSFGSEINSETIGRAMKRMVDHRHLMPEYGLRQTQHTPVKNDFLVMNNLPSVIVTGHTHIHSYDSYKGVKLINPGCFQYQTNYMRRNGIQPTDPSFTELNLNNGKVRTINVTP